MSKLDAMYAAAGKALRYRSVIRPTMDEMAKTAVDAAVAAMETEWRCTYGFDPETCKGDKQGGVLHRHCGTYAVVKVADEE